jgi:hypothetical protein
MDSAWRPKVSLNHRSIGGNTSTDRVLWVKALRERESEEKLRIEIFKS